jgi:hypothetical protein
MAAIACTVTPDLPTEAPAHTASSNSNSMSSASRPINSSATSCAWA